MTNDVVISRFNCTTNQTKAWQWIWRHANFFRQIGTGYEIFLKTEMQTLLLSFLTALNACSSPGISHLQWQGHNYFLSWREPWHKFEDWDWFNGRNFCRDRCMDLVSFDTPGEYELFAAIMKQGRQADKKKPHYIVDPFLLYLFYEKKK